VGQPANSVVVGGRAAGVVVVAAGEVVVVVEWPSDLELTLGGDGLLQAAVSQPTTNSPTAIVPGRLTSESLPP